MKYEDTKNIVREVSVEVWMDCGTTLGISQNYSASFVEATGLYVLTLPVSPNVSQIRFSPAQNKFISGHIISAADNLKKPIPCVPLNACSFEGMDVFSSDTPIYVLTVSGKEEAVTVAYTFEELSYESSSHIRTLISKKEIDLDFEKRKTNFRNEALRDLCTLTKKKLASLAPSEPEIRYIEKIQEIHHTDGYYEQYCSYKERYDAMAASTCWRVTKPLRKCMDLIRGKRIESPEKSVNLPGPSPESSVHQNLPQSKPWIAVHLHLYYEDLLEEFCGYLDHITEPFDLYISCKEGADMEKIRHSAQRISNVKTVIVRETQNRGRDIAPFYVLFREELLTYECLLHIHSKKSLYTGEEKAEWRHWALDGVLKNKTAVAEILHYLKNAEPKAGLVFGEMTDTLPLMALHWLRNEPKGRELCSRLNIKFENNMFFYPVGSFFWARTDAIKPLFDLQLTYEDFDEEHGQIDATLAHALERVIACLVKQHGFRTCIFDPVSEQFSFERSYKSFKTYFSYTKENIPAMLINNFELVSFDVFDTLITRLVYEPDDVFRLMERVIYSKWNKKISYLPIRKEAEALAASRKGDFCNINDIYESLPEVSVFTAEEANELKELEIQLEYDLCIPRKDSLEIFNRLVNAGKRVILVTDMYLTSEIITRMLKKCGYEGFEAIWVSCEKGLRKDRDTMWEEFFRVYGKNKTIHIGDNPHSDCQLVGDRMRSNMPWLSPRDQFHFSGQYEKFQRFLHTSVENALIMGCFVNQIFYNSPFALCEKGFGEINSIEQAAKGIFAPLFLCFSQYISKTCSSENTLLFLSREGYFIQRLYNKYCIAFGVIPCNGYYFLASRRAVSVAQIRDYKDAKELLKTNYKGKISTFFSERFGLETPQIEEDVHISLPGDETDVIGALTSMADSILKRSDFERNTYCSYLKALLGDSFDWDSAVIVDVGYAGTIQYYLMKILDRPLDGRYLATEYNVKPLKLGGSCSSLYNFKTSKLFEDTQLFLEAVTAAPFGQLICFDKDENGSVLPIYKEKTESCWQSAKKFQEYIYEYVEMIGSILKDIQPCFDKELAETILSEVLRAGIFGEKMEGIFTVYDGYCMDGEWVYDEKETKWVLVGKSNS